ncbi:MAG TPA: protein kinase, partial [Bryobacteraceae bacterium]|nr:protein kinase [Bryobacteraceae bacterium]
MGDVYLAQKDDGQTEQKVAIKVLRADGNRPAWRQRLLRERHLLASLNHPSIARLLDAGYTDDGRPYLVMEYVDGVAIDRFARGLDFRRKLSLFLQVCEGVSHAHHHSIIHRDLKPSNILVDSSGRPKILDFGIGKVLGAADRTCTVERLLTPNYASPEQLRGDAQTAGTDIYSLGAVLYQLLTGRLPREPRTGYWPDEKESGDGEHVTAPSRLNTELPRDLDYIVLKALRYDPRDRYASVEALTQDIGRLLAAKPVRARFGNGWYSVFQFLRRNRAAVLAGMITIASICAGLEAANDQRRIARGRSQQVRQLANKVLALDEATGELHSSNKARYEVVTMSKEYLEALSADARVDQNLALEIGRAYSLLARAQGISAAANVDQQSQAEDSLRKAAAFVDPVLRARPNHREALLTGARIHHDRMIIAQAEHRKEEAVAQAHQAVEYLDRLLSLGGPSPGEAEAACEFFYYIASVHKDLHLFEDGIRYSQRSVEISRSLPNGAFRTSLGMSMLADLRRLTGDLEGALQAIREARSYLQQAQFPSELARRSSWVTLLWREGKIVGAANGLSLNRSADAIAVLQKAFDLTEEWTQNDPDGAWNRLFFASLGRELGELLRARDPARALAIYDHGLRRLREIPNNREARRGEVELLAGSSYALRRLGRIGEARDRIEAALRLLSDIKDYPAAEVAPHSVAESTLRALGEHLAETGQPQEAAQVYADLLAKLLASKPDPQNDLRHAVDFSQIYGSLAVLHMRCGMDEQARALSALRVGLWRHWDDRFPDNALIQRQLELAQRARFQSRLRVALVSRDY